MGIIAYHRPTTAYINLSALEHNIRTIQKKLKKEKKEIFAVVKANAYGHGLLKIAKTALEAGAKGLCVAYLDEALELRADGITAPILVLGVLEPVEDVVLAAKNDISLTVGSVNWLERAKALLDKDNLQVKVHIAIDTGMGRIGFTDRKDMIVCKKFLLGNTFISEGLFTHFATADEIDQSYFHKQQESFKAALEVFEDIDFKYIHTANTATTIWHDAWHSNIVRLGIGMYGLNPSNGMIDLPYPLRPVMTLESELVFVKSVPANTSISYGATYTTEQDEWIGTVPIGYADGIPRSLTGFNLLVDGFRCPIVGRVAMDQLMIKLPREYAVGTKVVIIGQSNTSTNTFDDMARYVGTINYELTCAISERVKRFYIKK